MTRIAQVDQLQFDELLARQKIRQVINRLGLNFTDCSGVVDYDAEAPLSYWRYDPTSGAETLYLNAQLAALSVNSLELVLRHELLFRATYHAFAQRAAYPFLADIALDIFINRVLYECSPALMDNLCAVLYKHTSHKKVAVLANCHVNPSRIDPEFAPLWRDLWTTPHPLNLNPVALYYRLQEWGNLAQCQRCRKEVWPISRYRPESTDPHDPLRAKAASLSDLPERPSFKLASLSETALKHLAKASARAHALAEYLVEFSVIPLPIGTQDLEQFIRRIRVRRVADATAAKVTEPYQHVSRFQVYPLFPSRLGILYKLCGLSDSWKLYHNRDVTNDGARMRIGVYVDVSGSMTGYYREIAAFIEALKEYPLALRIFDTRVRDMDIAQFTQGSIQGGGGTDFNPPIVDFVETPDMEAGVLFTDGAATVSAETAQKLRQSHKRLYVVYICDTPCIPDSPLNQYAYDVITLCLSSA